MKNGLQTNYILTALNTNKKHLVWILVLILGTALRYWFMTLGYNYDFESYCIVGEIVNRGDIVYAHTERYNYGFVFFCIQGGLYHLAQMTANPMVAYRIFLVTMLTITDLGIVWCLVKKGTELSGILYYLSPISIFITGYHNQFDNIAILFALLSLFFVQEEERLRGKDWIAIILLSVSLMVKHIFCFFFLWLLIRKKGITFWKRMAYACVPPAVFLISFLPFIFLDNNALAGIINNVFKYRSIVNYPLLGDVLLILGIPHWRYIIVYILLLVVVSIIFRKLEYKDMLLLYLAFMVALSTSIANQYLVIPLCFLCVFDKKTIYCLYNSIGFIYLLFSQDGFMLGERLSTLYPKYASLWELLGSKFGPIIALLMWILVLGALWHGNILLKNLNQNKEKDIGGTS